jgi:molybdopterin synthase sulfur carrier subunit
MRVTVRYFASLRELAGRDAELLDTEARDAAALFHELRARHGIDWPADRLRVAVNGAFADWSTRLAEGDEVVFLPPVSGG